MNIYPKPTGDMLTGRYVAATSAQYHIFSMDGQLMMTEIVLEGEISIPITGLATGVYMIKLVTGSGSQGVASFIRK